MVQALVRALVVSGLALSVCGCGQTGPAAGTAPAGVEPTATVADGKPQGLFFMTRFWSGTGTLEKAVWYFAPDGSVYRDLETGFSEADLAAHAGPKGKITATGKTLVVTWSDGKTTDSAVEPSDTAFTWDMGIFTPVTAIAAASDIVGKYDGGESVSGGGSRVATVRSLELKADGTYTSSGIGTVQATDGDQTISAGAEDSAHGTWKAAGHSLELTAANGQVTRQICFPYDDDQTPIKPDRLFVGGLMYKKQ